MQGKHGHLSREQKQLALTLHAQGWRLVDIAREIGSSVLQTAPSNYYYEVKNRQPCARARRDLLMTRW